MLLCCNSDEQQQALCAFSMDDVMAPAMMATVTTWSMLYQSPSPPEQSSSSAPLNKALPLSRSRRQQQLAQPAGGSRCGIPTTKDLLHQRQQKQYPTHCCNQNDEATDRDLWEFAKERAQQVLLLYEQDHNDQDASNSLLLQNRTSTGTSSNETVPQLTRFPGSSDDASSHASSFNSHCSVTPDATSSEYYLLDDGEENYEDEEDVFCDDLNQGKSEQSETNHKTEGKVPFRNHITAAAVVAPFGDRARKRQRHTRRSTHKVVVVEDVTMKCPDDDALPLQQSPRSLVQQSRDDRYNFFKNQIGLPPIREDSGISSSSSSSSVRSSSFASSLTSFSLLTAPSVQ